MSRKTSAASPGYVPGIDGLRAIAVLSVIFFHLKPTVIPGGFSGVDVFFVISGYVVSASLARERETHFLNFALSFYARRIVRIFPALVVCLVAASLFTTLFVPVSWLSDAIAQTGLYAFFGLGNYALIWFDDGYFSPHVGFNTFTHTWSLAVEEQFYLIYPLLLFAWLKSRAMTGMAARIARWSLPALAILSFLYSIAETRAAPAQAYYLLPSRFWELACGGMLFMLHAQDRLCARSRAAADASLIVGLVLVGIGFALSDARAFPFPWAIFPVVGTSLIMIGVISDYGRGTRVSALFDNRLSIYIGKISYSLYLWHWPVIVLLRWTIGVKTGPEIAIALVLTAMLSAASYHFVEAPVRRAVSRGAWAPFKIVSLGLTMIVACFALSNKVFSAQQLLTLSVTRDARTWYPYFWRHPSATPETKHRLFVLGDSHADAYSTMLAMLRDDDGVKFQLSSDFRCAVANLMYPLNAECRSRVDKALSEIEASGKPGDVVFLVSLRMNRLCDQSGPLDHTAVIGGQSSDGAAARRLAAREEASAIIGRLEKHHMRVILDAPLPVFKVPPFRCSDWFNSGNPDCAAGFGMERRFLLEYREPVMESLEALKRDHPTLVVWDPLPVLCPGDECLAVDGGKPLFFDGDHLSAHGNRVLYPAFRSLLTSLWSAAPTRGQ